MAKAPPQVRAGRRCLSKSAVRKPWENVNAVKRILKGQKLQAARRKLFSADPLCADCKKEGKTKLAVIRDHIIPLAFGGEDVEDNTQGLCKDHHDAKTRRESREGKRRKTG